MKQVQVLSVAVSVVLLAALSGLATDLVCTTTIIADVVAQIAGDEMDVIALFPPNADPHAFEPRPQDLVTLHRADLVFINGLDLEASLDDILESIKDRVVSLSAHLPNLLAADAEVGHEDHVTYDPHVWFDPTLVSAWVDVIADRLSQFAPSLEPEFRARAASFQSVLANLDEWIESILETIPTDRRLLVTDHRVFGYFARRYGFEQVGTIFPGFSTVSEPSARELAELITTIESLEVPAVFVGTTLNPSLAQQVASDTGTRIVVMYTGALSDLDGPADTYVNFMRYTANAILEGLGASE